MLNYSDCNVYFFTPPKADLKAEGWGNNMIEAYTGNHAGHRAVRNRLKVDIAP